MTETQIAIEAEASAAKQGNPIRRLDYWKELEVLVRIEENSKSNFYKIEVLVISFTLRLLAIQRSKLNTRDV